MHVLDMAIDWNHGYANDPVLCLQVDRIFYREEFVYEEKDGIYYGVRGEQASFFAWKGPGNEGGFGGEDYILTMKDGTTATLKGPWSSRSSVINHHFEEQCIEVRLTKFPLTKDPDGRVRSENGFLAGAITTKLAGSCLNRLGAHLEKNCLPFETIYRIVDNETGGKARITVTRGIQLVIADISGKTGHKVTYKDEDGHKLSSPSFILKDMGSEDLAKFCEHWEKTHDYEVKKRWWEE